MLTGKELGAAIDAAIQKKIDTGKIRTKAEVAREFDIKPPSLHDWIKRGTVSKERLPHIWRYFSDVVGPEHWGVKAFDWPTGLAEGGASPEEPTPAWPFSKIDEKKIRALSSIQLVELETLMLVTADRLGLDVKKDG